MKLLPQFLYITFVCLPIFCSLENRLDCLQRPLGLAHTGKWTKDFVFSPDLSLSESPTEWAYINDACPLHQFDMKSFCSRVCGKQILIVGDSTMATVVDFWEHNLPHGQVMRLPCKFNESCSQKRRRPGTKGCVNDPARQVAKKRSMVICPKFCNRGTRTSIKYIRHDYLLGKHGEWYYQSGTCEEWREALKVSDVVWISFGAHIPAMIDFPYTQPATRNHSIHALLHETAMMVANELSKGLKKNAKVMYSTAHTGVVNYTSDCDKEPLEAPPPPETKYHWSMIPVAQDIYMHELKRVVPKRRPDVELLLMNHQNLFAMRPGCRHDYIHFKYESWKSPVGLEWQIFYNLLMES